MNFLNEENKVVLTKEEYKKLLTAKGVLTVMVSFIKLLVGEDNNSTHINSSTLIKLVEIYEASEKGSEA
jgi:hypothetical protein